MDIKQIAKSAADKFCGWKLPKDFYPDSFISFDREKHDTWGGYPNSWPTGTNLLTHEQAQAMFEYCLVDVVGQQGEPVCFMSPKQLDRIQQEFLSQFGVDRTKEWSKWMQDTSHTASASFPKQCEAAPSEPTITVQQAWEWAGGNPGIKATVGELKEALQMLDKICDDTDTTIQKEKQPVVVSQSLNALLKDAENAIFSLLSANAMYQIANCTQFDQKQRAAKELIAAEREALIVGDRIASLFGEE